LLHQRLDQVGCAIGFEHFGGVVERLYHQRAGGGALAILSEPL
jgi:hypothetical protein